MIFVTLTSAEGTVLDRFAALTNTELEEGNQIPAEQSAELVQDILAHKINCIQASNIDEVHAEVKRLNDEHDEELKRWSPLP